MNIKTIPAAVAASLLFATTAPAQAASLTVSITNLTSGFHFTPRLLVAHDLNAANTPLNMRIDNVLGISSLFLVLSIAENRNCCVKEPPKPNKKLARENRSNRANLVAEIASKPAIKRQPIPVNAANLRPFFLAIIAAGIEPAATPNIIKLIGNVANEGLVVNSFANMPQ